MRRLRGRKESCCSTRMILLVWNQWNHWVVSMEQNGRQKLISGDSFGFLIMAGEMSNLRNLLVIFLALIMNTMYTLS